MISLRLLSRIDQDAVYLGTGPSSGGTERMPLVLGGTQAWCSTHDRPVVRAAWLQRPHRCGSAPGPWRFSCTQHTRKCHALSFDDEMGHMTTPFINDKGIVVSAASCKHWRCVLRELVASLLRRHTKLVMIMRCCRWMRQKQLLLTRFLLPTGAKLLCASSGLAQNLGCARWASNCPWHLPCSMQWRA